MAVKQLKMQAQSEEAMEGEGDEATPFAEFRKEVAAMRYGTYNTPATTPGFWKYLWISMCARRDMASPSLTHSRNLSDSLFGGPADCSGLQHPNILSLHGVCLEPLAMVVDFMPDGPLDDFLADASRRA